MEGVGGGGGGDGGGGGGEWECECECEGSIPCFASLTIANPFDRATTVDDRFGGLVLSVN